MCILNPIMPVLGIASYLMLRKCFHSLELTTCHLLSEHSLLNESGEKVKEVGVGGWGEEAGKIRGNSWELRSGGTL